jgi:signal transduction histidine kinase
MVVDDNQANRELLSTVLGYGGYRVIEAPNGADGLELAKAECPDLVIADVLMPKMDGYEFVRRLRTDPRTASSRVIFHTAEYLEGEVKMMAAACGVEHILPKPSDPEMILAIVEKALGAEPLEVAMPDAEFQRGHLALLNDKLIQKVNDLEEAGAARRRLLAHLVNVQEEERKTIAGDIHDDSIQVMSAVRMRLEMLGRTITEPEQRAKFAKLEETTQLAIARLRHLLFQLRPPALDREGFPAALEAHLKEVCGDAGMEYTVENRARAQPSAEMKVILYRIAQEAVANILKHAGAKSISVVVDEAGHGVRVRIVDDGAGFVPDPSVESRPGHMGISAMRERAEIAGGSLEIASTPGAGATVTYWLPMPEAGGLAAVSREA